MVKSFFDSLSDHVLLEAGKYGLGARLRIDEMSRVECRIFDPTAPATQPPVALSKELSQCEGEGVSAFDQFITREAVPKLKPKG